MAGSAAEIGGGIERIRHRVHCRADAELATRSARTLGTTTPDVMLLEMTDFDRDLPQAAAIHEQSPDVPIVGLASRDLQLLLNRSANSDVTSFAGVAIHARRVGAAISSAVHKMHGGIHENLVAFLPRQSGKRCEHGGPPNRPRHGAGAEAPRARDGRGSAFRLALGDVAGRAKVFDSRTYWRKRHESTI